MTKRRGKGRKVKTAIIALIVLNEIRGLIVVGTVGWPVLRAMF